MHVADGSFLMQAELVMLELIGMSEYSILFCFCATDQQHQPLPDLQA